MILLTLLLTACWAPRDTGPTSMVGHLLDADGTPISGAAVETVESRSVTDETGRFAVNYKAPSQYVHLTHEGIWFKRTYTPADDKTEVRLQLPERHARTFVCDADASCQATLTWKLGEHFEGVVRTTCDPDEPVKTLTVPSASPADEVVCRTGATGADEPMHQWSDEAGTRISPPPVTLEVQLTTGSEDTRPTTCVLTADDKPLQPAGENTWTGEVFGRVLLKGTCDGVPLQPKLVQVRKAGTVQLQWSPEAPTLDLISLVPAADRLLIARSYGEDLMWRLELTPNEEGIFVLPQLGTGMYLVGVGAEWEGFNTLRPASDEQPDILHLVRLPHTDAEGQPYIVGAIEVSSPLPGGPITVEIEDVPPPSTP
jgi:hypothetical protein